MEEGVVEEGGWEEGGGGKVELQRCRRENVVLLDSEEPSQGCGKQARVGECG